MMKFPHELDFLTIVWGAVFLFLCVPVVSMAEPRWIEPLGRPSAHRICSPGVRWMPMDFVGGWVANLVFGKEIHKHDLRRPGRCCSVWEAHCCSSPLLRSPWER